MNGFANKQGQSLIEVVIGLTIGALIIGGVSAGLATGLKSNAITRQEITATQVAQKTLDNVRALAESDWNTIYSASKDATTYIYSSGTNLVLTGNLTGNEAAIEVSSANITYTPSFVLNNVFRNTSGEISTSGDGDPSTQKVTVSVSWKPSGSGTNRSISLVSYIVRTKNISALFSDWSAGPDNEGPVTSANDGFSSSSMIDYSTAGELKVEGY
jgi:Tfp pilus assembly protein PilV